MTASFEPGLVALDIDGTLLRWDHDSGGSESEVTGRVADAVLRVVAAGVPVVLASGRAPHSMAIVADAMGLTRACEEPLWVVASNGAVVVRHSAAGLELVHEVTFDASEAVRTVLEHVPNAAVAVEEHGVGYRVNRPFPDGELHGELILTDLEELVRHEVSRVVIRDPESTSEDFKSLAGQLGLHGTNYFIGWTAWLDLAPEGVSKASGLERVCERLGIQREQVLAMGDGRNDIEMLEWAGRGVAMGQAVPEVRAVADDVALSVDEDGAAVELERWFPA